MPPVEFEPMTSWSSLYCFTNWARQELLGRRFLKWAFFVSCTTSHVWLCVWLCSFLESIEHDWYVLWEGLLILLGRHTKVGYMIVLARCSDNCNDTCRYICASVTFIVVLLVVVPYQWCVLQSSWIWGNKTLSNNITEGGAPLQCALAR